MKVKRILMSVLGVVLCGISVGFFKVAAFGVDPFQSFMSGIDKTVPLSFGVLNVVVNALLLVHIAERCMSEKRISLITRRTRNDTDPYTIGQSRRKAYKAKDPKHNNSFHKEDSS
jgi:hypothetical protein